MGLAINKVVLAAPRREADGELATHAISVRFVLQGVRHVVTISCRHVLDKDRPAIIVLGVRCEKEAGMAIGVCGDGDATQDKLFG